jgi:signal transduction histidine kinase
MIFYIISQLLNALVSGILGLIVYFSNKNKLANKLFAMHNFAIAVWAFCFFKMVTANNDIDGLIWARSLHYGAILIPVFFLHFTYAFLQNTERKKRVIIAAYLIGLIFLAAVPTDFFVSHTVAVAGFKYFVGPTGWYYYIFPLFFALCIATSFYELLKDYQKCEEHKKNTLRYILGGHIVGYVGGVTAFFPLFNIPIPKWSLFTISIYAMIITYAIIKHQLMDIRIAITRAGIFLFVYSFVLGIPFFIGYKTHNWLLSTSLGVMLASFGFLVYTNLRLQLEKMFFHKQKLEMAATEQLRRQKTMDTFSASMAHEIINPVHAIMGLTGVLKERVLQDLGKHLDDKNKAYFTGRFDQVIELSARMETMIKAIREFAAKTSSEITKIRLGDALEGFLLIVTPQLKSNGIEIGIDGNTDININANKVLIEEVLVNLSINSIYAIKAQEPPNPVININIIPDAQRAMVTIKFSDNGCGIPKNLLEDIFLDFVTTKGSSENLGMGLSRARKIIQMHKGKIWAESEGEGKGATFFIELPTI